MQRAGWVSALAAAALVSLTAGPAHADAFAADFAAALGGALGHFFLIVFGVILSPVYVVLISLIEAYGLNLVLSLGYRRCLGYAVGANVISTAIGWVWYAVRRELGWKTSLLAYPADDAAASAAVLLFVRSFVVTLVVEGLVLTLLLCPQRRLRSVLLAATCANLLSYAALFVAMLVLSMWRWMPT